MNRKNYPALLLSAFTFLVLAFTTGCGIRNFPLKGIYSNQHSYAFRNQSKDSIWAALIGFCTTRGLSLKVVDKPSGLLTFEKSGIDWSFEDDSTWRPDHPKSWVVIPRARSFMQEVKPYMVEGEWSVRLQDGKEGSTTAIIDLVYIKNTSVYAYRNGKYAMENISNGYSTGMLEQSIFSSIGKLAE